MTTPTRDKTHRCDPITLLQREWSRLTYCQQTLDRVNEWRLVDRRLHSLDELLCLAGYHGAKHDEQADRVLAEIVRRARNDQLAARIVLQRVFPPMLAIARRRGRIRTLGFDYAFSLVLSHAWEVIRTYPIERRPAKIAANIVRDIEYFAFVRRERKRPKHDRIDDCWDLVVNYHATDSHGRVLERGARENEPDTETLVRDVLSEARDVRLSRSSLELLDQLRSISIEEYARRHGVTVRTARTWRRKAVSELRARMQYAA